MEILRQATPCTNVQYIQLQSTNKDLKWTVKLKPIMSDFIMDTHRVARAKSCFNHLLNMQFSDIENSKFHRSTNFQISKIVIRGSLPTCSTHRPRWYWLIGHFARQHVVSLSCNCISVSCAFVFRMYCTSVNWTFRQTALSLPIQWGLSKLALKHSSM